VQGRLQAVLRAAPLQSRFGCPRRRARTFIKRHPVRWAQWKRALGDREPVVIATDGSHGAEAAVDAGARVARMIGTSAIVVYVRPSLGPLGDPYYQEKADRTDGIRPRRSRARARASSRNKVSKGKRRFSREARLIESPSSRERVMPPDRCRVTRARRRSRRTPRLGLERDHPPSGSPVARRSEPREQVRLARIGPRHISD
jgi:hypothetical protein